ncbi:MAG: Gfo/Idh/MocA family oxidoreductase, partial [Candidatus Poribacteria bacterium]|nr:Gfo/Idh/MocA family oxidoreductase [Candidatus Poribacteria bacterium]
MKEELKIGIVGANRGSSFMVPFTAISETKITAICDLNEDVLEETGEKFGIEQRFTQYEEMLDQIDVVVLATPENLHVPQSILALEAGKHVISEVTAAVSIGQCYQLVETVQNSQAKYMMAENMCYHKPNVLIKNMVQQGVFGKVYFGEAEYVHD